MVIIDAQFQAYLFRLDPFLGRVSGTYWEGWASGPAGPPVATQLGGQRVPVHHKKWLQLPILVTVWGRKGSPAGGQGRQQGARAFVSEWTRGQPWWSTDRPWAVMLSSISPKRWQLCS